MGLQVSLTPGSVTFAPSQPAAQTQAGEFSSAPGAQYQRRLKIAEEVLESYRNRLAEHESRLQYLKNLIERVPAARGEKGERGECGMGLQGQTGLPGPQGPPGAPGKMNLKDGWWFRFWRKWLLGTDG